MSDLVDTVSVAGFLFLLYASQLMAVWLVLSQLWLTAALV